MLRDVAWGELDIMVVDLPPGTGDAQLTMAQQVPLAGAVIVSTPQDIALIDARRGLSMFQKVDVPVLGIIENMSYFLCPHCGERSDIFSHGGARREAERLGTDFLGEVPLDLAIRETSDEGRPITVSDPGSPYAQIFREIAAKVWAKVSGEAPAPPRRAAHRGRVRARLQARACTTQMAAGSATPCGVTWPRKNSSRAERTCSRCSGGRSGRSARQRPEQHRKIRRLGGVRRHRRSVSRDRPASAKPRRNPAPSRICCTRAGSLQENMPGSPGRGGGVGGRR